MAITRKCKCKFDCVNVIVSISNEEETIMNSIFHQQKSILIIAVL